MSCPYTGPEPYKGAQYVRKCKELPNLCSCIYWKTPEIFNQCSTKQDADYYQQEKMRARACSENGGSE